MQRWFLSMPLLQVACALLALVYVLGSPLMAPKAAPDEALFGRTFFAIAVIFVIGAVVDSLARRAIANAVFLPEIARLAGDACFDGSSARPQLFAAIPLILIGGLILLAGDYMIISQYQDRIGPWSWRAPLALALCEAIYLAWQFEGLALKSELQFIARRWDRLKRLDRPKPPVMVIEAETPSPSPPASPSPPVLDAAWAEHIRDLLSELSHHGFDVTPPAPCPQTAASAPNGAVPPPNGTRKP